MKKRILALLGAVVATAGLAQDITPVWYEHINELYNVNPADKLPILRIQNGTDFLNNFGHGDVQFDCYAKFLKYDDDHYLLGIRENGITESDATLSDSERALSQAWPDRTILWIDAHTGKVLGIALSMPVFPVQNATQNNSDAWWKWGIDDGPNGQRVIYSTYRYKILRWAPTGTVADPAFPSGRATWSTTPTEAYVEPVPDEPNPTYPPLDKFVPAIHYANADTGLPAPVDASDPNYVKYVGSSNGDGNTSWRLKAFRVSGSGADTKLWAGGATWRASMLEQEFATDDGGMTFYPISRLSDRGDCYGHKSCYSLGGEPSSIRADASGRSWCIQGHYPGTGWGARPGRYIKDPAAANDDGHDGTVTPATDANDSGVNHKARPHFFDTDNRELGGLPAFEWESAGTKGNPGPNWDVDNMTRYAGNWIMGIDTKPDLDYIVTYSMPSWNDDIGTDPVTGLHRKTPGWMGVHDLDGNIAPGNSSYKLNFRETDEIPATYGDVGVDYNYDGDVEIYPDPTAPAGSQRSLVLWCGANFGFGVFKVENKPMNGTLTPPGNVTTVENRDINLTGSFSGTGGPVFYRWQKDDGTGNFVDIPGKKGNVAKLGKFAPFTLSFPIAQTSVSGRYRVVLTNPMVADLISAVATVVVNPDHTPPVPLHASSLDGNSIDICFDELLDPRLTVDVGGTAIDYFNYTISGGNGVSGAILLPDGKTVRLTGITPPVSGAFTVNVVNVTDLTEDPANAIPAPGVNVSGSVLNLTETSLGTNPQGQYYVCDPGQISVDAGGGDVWDPNDSVNFLYKQVSGDFDYAVRVLSVTQPNNRDGLMVRQTLDANAAMVAELAQGGQGFGQALVGPFKRDTLGGGIGWVPPHTDWDHSYLLPNVWLRIQRLGDNFNFFKSRDGVNWVNDGTYALTMTDPVYLGLATDNGGNTTTLSHVVYSGFAPVVGVAKAIIVTWVGVGTLQSSTDMVTWTDVPGSPTSPYSTPDTGAQVFYRVLFPQ